MVWNFASLIVCRLCFGVGEAGCFPNATKIFTIWLPSSERVRAQGILWLAARWGGAFIPLLVVAAINFVSWRWAFWVFGLVGLVWAWAFYRWFRDRPGEHPAVNAAELSLLDGAESNVPGHAAIPWARLLASRTVWMLWLQYFCLSYGWYFYITWLPTYLREARHMNWGKGAVLAGLPLFFGGIGCFAGGWLARRIAAGSGNVRRARRVVTGGGLFCAGLLLVVASQLGDPLPGMVAFGFASFANDTSPSPPPGPPVWTWVAVMPARSLAA